MGKGLQAMIEEASIPESFKVGQKFENYVRETIFIDRYYDLMERTHQYLTNKKDFVESTLKPDFTFRDRLTKQVFYVEVKFRTRLYNGKISVCNEYQLPRYQYYDLEHPTFLLLGMGEKPEKPHFLSLIPIGKVQYPDLFPSFVRKFEVKVDEALPSKILWVNY
jgi:hypothetical protein